MQLPASLSVLLRHSVRLLIQKLRHAHGHFAMNRAEVNASASSAATLDDLYRLVAGEFDKINALIPNQLTSDVDMVEEIGHYIVERGKRLRPMLVLLSSQALAFRVTPTSAWPPSSSFCIPQHCCTMMSLTVLPCVAGARLQTTNGVMRQAFWSAIFCIRSFPTHG